MSELCLGTAQLGLKYGVNNELGRQPTQEESCSVLQAALEMGIYCFDTASAYGTAETILGEFGLAERHDIYQRPVRVISKLRPNCPDDAETVLNEICDSLSRLHAKKLYGYMLHRASDIFCKELMKGLVRAKDCGLVEHIGVSVYEPQEAMDVVRDGCLDMIQVPYNVLDTRLEQNGFFSLAKKRGMEVYARSAFLQGLLLMEPEQAEMKVPGAGVYVRQFQSIAFKRGFTPGEAAFLWSCCHPSIDYLVFGVDTVAQLKENRKIVDKTKSFFSCMEELQQFFSDVDMPREVIVPSLWHKQ